MPLRRVGVIADSVGVANFALADVSGDGISDVISCSANAPFAVSTTGAATFGISWYGPPLGCKAIATGDRDGDGGNEVFIVTEPYNGGAGTLMVFDPRSLGGPIASILLPGTAGGADIAFADVDGDAHPEIIVATSAATYVYDSATLALEWTASGYGGTKIRVGQLDADSRLEIVVNGSTGYVLDAVAQTLKWGYLGGFGRIMDVGDVDSDGRAEIVFVQSYSTQVTILNGDTFATSTIPSPDALDSIAVGDGNNDGVNEIVAGNNQWGAIKGLTPSNGAVLWSINNPEHGAQAVAVGDVNGDGQQDVIWGAGISSSGQDVLYIGNANTQTITWQSIDLDSSFSSVTGDIDGDGRQELIVASGSSRSGYSGSIIEIFDLATGASEGTFAPSSSYSFGVDHVAIGQLDADPAKELVALGGSYYDPQLIVWDGVTKAVEFSSTIPPCCSSSTFGTTALAVANIDGDAVDEIIVAGSDPKIVVLNGASNIIQNSVPVNGAITDFSVADLDGNGGLDLAVSTTSGIYVYDTATWSLHGSVALANTGYEKSIATNAGKVAVSYYDGLWRVGTYSGINLTPDWTCTSAGSYAIEIASIGGALHVIDGGNDGVLRLFPMGGNVCPAFTSTRVAGNSIVNLKAVEVTGDARPDLLIDTLFASEVHLIGLGSDVRGDVTGEGLINAADIDGVANYVFGATNGINPSADANADQRVSPEDVLKLIHYAYGGGVAPPP